jgi:hypothetical protein
MAPIRNCQAVSGRGVLRGSVRKPQFTAEASNIIHLGDARTFRFCYSRSVHKTKLHTTKANPPRGRGRKAHGSLREIARLPKGDGSGNVRAFAVINKPTRRRRHPDRRCPIGGGKGTAPRSAEGRPPSPSHPSRTGQLHLQALPEPLFRRPLNSTLSASRWPKIRYAAHGKGATWQIRSTLRRRYAGPATETASRRSRGRSARFSGTKVQDKSMTTNAPGDHPPPRAGVPLGSVGTGIGLEE